MQSYGDTSIAKLECIGHVEKRTGTRLRALKLKMKGKKLNDKKTLGDHGRLTDAEIDKLQRYYGLAIRNNTDSINSMKRAIWATYFHKLSRDAYPQHGMCPTNEDTWCGCKRAITTGFYTVRAIEADDRERLRKANYDILQNSKEARALRQIKIRRLSWSVHTLHRIVFEPILDSICTVIKSSGIQTVFHGTLEFHEAYLEVP
ncbi:uncharacterized protein TNCV_2885881 [Trichonephila clavipes]|nr:uncharacterized protein TNCV_2885881 [Trichonephila clavipes]